MSKWVSVGVLLGLFLLLGANPLAAQSAIVVTTQSVEVRFPREMQFEIEASSAAPITRMRLSVWQTGVALGSRHTPSFTPAKTVRTQVEWGFQAFSEGGYLPPGTRGEYAWHIEDAAGNVIDTPRKPYAVEDKRQAWHTLENENLRVHWTDGGDAFGLGIFARAVSARAYLTDQLAIQDVAPIEIFIYGDKQKFFEALPAFSAEWTGGRAFPEYGVILINFGADNLEWGMRATSHELSHAVLHAKIKGTIGALSLPHWLDEGLAVYNETNDHAPDPQFEEGFQRAVRRNTLIPLRRLELRFPTDSDQAQLAYGQGYSVVRYLIETHGEDKFAELLSIYQAGATPDDGLRRVYGMNQDAIENEWRKQMGAPERLFTDSVLATAPPRPTYDLSTGVTRVPTQVSVAATDAPLPTAVAILEPPSPATEPSSASLFSVCGMGLLIGGVGTAWLVRRGRKIDGR